ncbi:hypothetical protein WH47_12575 [Habropoda laboriosa]|uniref:Uncharacterized protein n=1 Tax=Habropoda laboriosa TaxID=597456 RepID=A0A0L7R8Y3_9HYME|nr:hypothetical protein WH47_12575 [Habropoda laboriosa]
MNEVTGNWVKKGGVKIRNIEDTIIRSDIDTTSDPFKHWQTRANVTQSSKSSNVGDRQQKAKQQCSTGNLPSQSKRTWKPCTTKSNIRGTERCWLASDNSVNWPLIKQAQLEAQKLEQGKARQSLERCLSLWARPVDISTLPARLIDRSSETEMVGWLEERVFTARRDPAPSNLGTAV